MATYDFDLSSQAVENMARLEDELANSASSFQEVVLPAAILLFLRWLEHFDAEQAAVAAFEGRDYAQALPDELSWHVLNSKRGRDLGKYLDEIMLPSEYKAAQGAAREKYLQLVVEPKVRQVMSHPYGQAIRLLAMSWPRLQALPEHVRDALLEMVGGLSLDRLKDRQLAEHLLSTMIRLGASSRSAFYMPEAAADLMIEVAQPQPGERVYDPCFGSGSLLVAAARRMRMASMFYAGGDWDDAQKNSLFGVDHYPNHYFVGLVRVILAGIEHPGLELGDALQRPRIRSLSREGFDCILAVPPWRRMERGYSASGSFDIPTTSIEGLFLQHIASSLRPGGRAVVALPASFLFSAGSEKRVRKMLVEDFRVEGVIGLPSRIYKPYTSIETSLLVFSRNKPAEAVRFLSYGALRGAGAKPDAPEAKLPFEIASDFRARILPQSAWETPVKALAVRGYDLTPRRTGDEELQAELDAILRIDPQTRLVRLEEIAALWQGINYRREDVIDATPGKGDEDAIDVFSKLSEVVFSGLDEEIREVSDLPDLIRAGNIKQLGVSPSFLTLKNLDLLQKNIDKRLRKDDLLITVGGTIGNIGIVSAGTVGDLPSRNLVAMRINREFEGVSPNYLAIILSSSLYQKWLSGHARGSVIQHLSITALRELVVPIPSLPAQERVVQACWDGKRDGLNELLRLLTAEISDPVSLWLEKSDAADVLSQAISTNATIKIFPAMEMLSREFRELRNDLAHEKENGEPWLREWVFRTWEALSRLDGIANIPTGMGRLNILERTRGMLASSLSVGGVGVPGVTRARWTTEQLLKALDVLIEEILGDVRVVSELDTSSIPANEPSIVTVTLKNESPVALRNFFCETTLISADLKVPYFAEGQSEDIVIGLLGADAPRLDFSLIWSATRLDGKKVSGQIPLSLDVSHAGTQVTDENDLGPNPYIAGPPVNRPEMFFGRQGVIDTIKHSMSGSTHANVLLLEGNRRAGKSSILMQLEPVEALPDWVVVRCDFQGASGHETKDGIPTENIFAHMAQKIAEAGERYGYKFWPPAQAPYEPGKPYTLEFRRAFSRALKEFPPFEMFKEFLESVLDTIAPKRLLLMLDEFDRIQEGIDSGVTSPQVPQNIRFILQNYAQVSSILTGSRRMTQMRKDYWSVLFGLGHRINITAIDQEEARRLVTVPVKGRLVYPPQVVDQIIGLCACQPYLIQRLCNQIFNTCVRSKQSTVTLAMVDEAAMELVTGMEHFEAFWEFAGDERARFILCIVHRLGQEADSPPVTLPMIEDELQKSGVELKREELVGDELKKLIELELISMAKEGQYRVEVPLLSLWISRNKDCEDQRERAVIESQNRSLA